MLNGKVMKKSFLSILLVILPICGIAGAAEKVPDIRAEIRSATGDFRDFTCVTQVVKRNDKVLHKMGKKFVQQYEIKKADTYFKMPDNVRMEGKIGLLKVQMIMTGNQRIFRVPSLRLTKKEDISEEGFKKQTCIDLGLLCESAWNDFDVKYISTEQKETGPAYIVDFTRRWENPKTYRISIDKKILRILKIEKRDAEGNLQAIFKFPEAKQLNGVIWAPSRAELYSPNGELAAVTEFYNMKANSGLSAKFFE